MWAGEQPLSSEWFKYRFCLFAKQTRVQRMEDLRPIALTSLWYRLFGRLLKPRLASCVSPLLPPWV
eukprot:5590874-Prorocentrum_lima.AAC.1